MLSSRFFARKLVTMAAVTNWTEVHHGHNNNPPDKILVVDDDARIRDLLRRYLTQEGLEVILAEDGKALNRILLRDTVDLIVLDLMMPGEDGLSICRRLRAANDRTPIVMLTAKGKTWTASWAWRWVPTTTWASLQPARTARPHPRRAAPPSAPGSPGAPSGDNEVVTFGPVQL